jgi:outer membrane protein assembly factor BamB
MMNARSERGIRLAVLLMAGALLASCSKDKDIEPPAELVDFKPSWLVSKAWTVGMGGGDDVQRLALAPAVEGEQAFLAGPRGDVVSVGLADGRSRWKADVERSLSAGPGVGSGLVVIGSPEGHVFALDIASGSLRWSARVNGEILAAPAVGPGRVVVHTVDGRVHALDAADGTLVWTYEQPAPRLTLRGSAPPVIEGGQVYCAFDNGKVAALVLESGDLLWSATVSAPSGRTEIDRLVDIDSAVAVTEGEVFAVGFQGRAAMIDRESGQLWWARDLSSHRGLALGRESLFVSDSEGAVVALSRRDGTERWRQGALRLRRLSPPVVDGEAVVVADFEGYLHWLDAGSGEFLARTRGPGARVGNPMRSADGLLLVQDDEGSVAAYRARPRG